jgi:transcriptional regulator with XRE-family HTH domain
MYAMTFGKKIDMLCERKGWTDAELARRVGVSKNTVGNWFRDERQPYQEVLLRLSELFEVPSDYLIDDRQDDVPAPELTHEERALLTVARRLKGGAAEAIGRIVNYEGLAIDPREGKDIDVSGRIEPTPPARPARQKGAG